MTTPEPDRECAAPRLRRFQYTLRTLFALTTAAAISCAVFFAMPVWVSVLAAVCVIISMPAVLTVMLIYGRGYTRTFCIGALFPAGICCLFPAASWESFEVVVRLPLGELLDSLEPNIGALVLLNVYFAVVLGNGLLAVGVRRLTEAGRPTAAAPSPTHETAEPEESDAGGRPTPAEEAQEPRKHKSPS